MNQHDISHAVVDGCWSGYHGIPKEESNPHPVDSDRWIAWNAAYDMAAGYREEEDRLRGLIRRLVSTMDHINWEFVKGTVNEWSDAGAKLAEDIAEARKEIKP